MLLPLVTTPFSYFFLSLHWHTSRTNGQYFPLHFIYSWFLFNPLQYNFFAHLEIITPLSLCPTSAFILSQAKSLMTHLVAICRWLFVSPNLSPNPSFRTLTISCIFPVFYFTRYISLLIKLFFFPIQIPFLHSFSRKSFVVIAGHYLFNRSLYLITSCDFYFKRLSFPLSGDHPILIHYHRVLELLQQPLSAGLHFLSKLPEW